MIRDKYKVKHLSRRSGKRSMLGIKAKCSICQKEIHPSEEIYVSMKYPEYSDMTEIDEFLQNKGKIICEQCFFDLQLNRV